MHKQWGEVFYLLFERLYNFKKAKRIYSGYMKYNVDLSVFFIFRLLFGN
jgi:hypothetical protein